jgi:hypothetical protein
LPNPQEFDAMAFSPPELIKRGNLVIRIHIVKGRSRYPPLVFATSSPCGNSGTIQTPRETAPPANRPRLSIRLR